MNKRVVLILLMIVLTPCPAFSSTAEPVENAYTATAQWNVEIGEVSIVGDPYRAIEVYFIGYDYQSVLYLPEDAPDGSAFMNKGVRVVFDAPLEDLMDTAYVLSPVSVEIIGDKLYGCIVDIGEDYVVHDRYNPNTSESFDLLGEPVRYNLSSELLLEYIDPLGPGSSCEMLIDEDGVVIAILERHG